MIPRGTTLFDETPRDGLESPSASGPVRVAPLGPLGNEGPSSTIRGLLRGDADAVEALRVAAALHASGALVAFEGAAPRAVLTGQVLHCGYLVRAIDGPSESFAAAVPALVDHLRAAFPGQRLEARLEGDTRSDPALRRALVNASAELALDQIRYDRDLAEPPAAAASPSPAIRGYEEVGRAGLVALLARIFSEGLSGCVTADAYDEAERMLFLARDASGRPDTSQWMFAFVDGAPAGLALAHLHGEAPRWGTLLHLGLAPALRGRRLGARLHAMALQRLAAAGATRYRDATAGANVAMRRVFEANGCRPSGAILHYVLRRPLESGHLQDLDGLAAYLRSERHRVEVSGGQRLHTVAVCAGEEARVEIAWDAGARVLHVTHRLASPIPAAERATAAQIVAGLDTAPGAARFFVDEGAPGAGVRVTLLLDEEGRLRVQQLRRALAAVVQGAGALQGEWRRSFGVAAHSVAARGVAAGGGAGSLLERVPVFGPGATGRRAAQTPRSE